MSSVSAAGAVMTLTLGSKPIQQAPAMTTGVASIMTATGATLNATVNPNAAATTVYFDYGLTTSFGSVVTYGAALSGINPLNVARAVSGLQCGRTYYYRARAANSGGTTVGTTRALSAGACAISH